MNLWMVLARGEGALLDCGEYWEAELVEELRDCLEEADGRGLSDGILELGLLSHLPDCLLTFVFPLLYIQNSMNFQFYQKNNLD